MNWLDILAGKGNQRYSGRYYHALPEFGAASAAPEIFTYEFVDVVSKEYRTILRNLIDTDSATTTIKTRSAITFSVNSLVALQDGNIYLITSVTTNLNSVSAEAARFHVYPKGVEKILRLMQVEDVHGIGGAGR